MKQQYIESRGTYNNNENEVKRSTNKLLDDEESNGSVYLRRGLRVVGVLIVIAAVAAVAYFTYMDTWIWIVSSVLLAGVLLLFITGLWTLHWFYIAAVTAPRDVK